jgi:general stress protein 26
MSEPRTHLDQRFSEPNASALTWAEIRAQIEQAELFWITTVRTDGRPHVTPLVAVWHQGALHFCTGAEEQKAVNLAANPNVALTTGTNEWSTGVDIVVEGRAEKVTDRDRLSELAAAWQGKWDGRWTFDAGEGGFTHGDGSNNVAEVYAVQPTRAFAFGKAPASHTTYRFA